MELAEYQLISACRLKLLYLVPGMLNFCNIENDTGFIFLYCCTVHSDVCRVQSSTNALFYFKKRIKIYIKYTKISLLNISVFDHHQGACTEPG